MNMARGNRLNILPDGRYEAAPRAFSGTLLTSRSGIERQ